MKKSLYKENFLLNSEGAELSSKVDSAIKNLFEQYIDKGYHLSEMVAIAYSSIGCTEAKLRLSHSQRIDREETKSKYRKEVMEPAGAKATK